jgi:hypothetical protein
MFTHPYISSQLNSEHITRLQVEAAAAHAARQARDARRQARAKSKLAARAPRLIWSSRTAVSPRPSGGLS